MIKEKIRDIVHHNLERYPQPIPTRNNGGDCFACATLAALRWLYPDKTLTFDQVWEAFLITQNNSDGSVTEFLGNAWHLYSQVFEQVKEKLDLTDLSWRINQSYPTFDSWGCSAGNWNRDNAQYGQYWRKLCEDLKNGIVVVSINMDGTGPWKDGRWNDTDHLVLIDGVREHTVPIPDMAAARIELEVHIVCSRDKGGWKTIHELLDLHGAGAWHVLERKAC